MKKEIKETDAWLALHESQKSQLVRTLHWFHFRPRQLAQSWRKEEVITWELLGALQTLPRSYFLENLLKRIAQVAPESSDVCSLLLQAIDEVEVEEYPSLQLGGKLHNRRSDIGFCLKGGPRLWIEIKTLSSSPSALMQQLEDQNEALATICADNPFSVVALLPATQSTVNWPSILWNDVAECLVQCASRLREDMDPGLSRGYLGIVDELKGRVLLHTEAIC